MNIDRNIKTRDQIISDFIAKNDGTKDSETVSHELELLSIRESLEMLEEPLLQGEEFDIYEIGGILVKYYYMTKPNSKTYIGRIEMNYGNNNIGYEIEEEYRGNRYIQKALELLKNEFTKRDVNEVIFCIKNGNVKSEKIAQNYGAELIGNKTKFQDGVNRYRAVITKAKSKN